MFDGFIHKRAFFCCGTSIGGLAVLHLSFSYGSLRVLVALQRLILDDIPRDVPVSIVGVDGVGIKADLSHVNNAVKIINRTQIQHLDADSCQRYPLVRKPCPVCLPQKLLRLVVEEGLPLLPQRFLGRVDSLEDRCFQFGYRNAGEGQFSEVEEQLGAPFVGLYLLHCEDAAEGGLVERSDEIGDIGVFGHLQYHILAEFEGVRENGGQFGLHDVIERKGGIVFSTYSAPRWTDDDGIGVEGLHLKEISIDEPEAGWALAIDLQVALEHVQFIRIDVVGHVFLEIASEVHRDPAHPTKGLKNTSHLVLFHPLQQVQGHRFGYG